MWYAEQITVKSQLLTLIRSTDYAELALQLKRKSTIQKLQQT